MFGTTKTSKAHDEAAARLAGGHNVFVTYFEPRRLHVDDLTELIEQVEGAGWTLTHSMPNTTIKTGPSGMWLVFHASR